jgi:hypothetical protein
VFAAAQFGAYFDNLKITSNQSTTPPSGAKR